MKEVTIDIGKEFSPELGPRYFSLGPHSGEEFRDDILIPAFSSAERVVVALDAIEGFSPSFLEEAFGGLVREFGIVAVRGKLSFDAVDNISWVPMIEAWMKEAEKDYKKGIANQRSRRQSS